MTSLVLEEGSVPIPSELADRFGIHAGTQVEWAATDDGKLTLRAASSRERAMRELRGSLVHTLKPGETATEAIDQLLAESRSQDPTY